MYSFWNDSTDSTDVFNAYLQQATVKVQTIFYFNPTQLRCWSVALLQRQEVAATLIWNTASAIHLKNNQNSHLLVLACLPGANVHQWLDVLAKNLEHMRQVKILLELNGAIANASNSYYNILKRCLQLGLLNAALIYSNFTQTLSFYTYQAYPTFQVLKQQLHNNQQKSSSPMPSLYPDKLLNMYGHSIYSMPDHSEPYTIVYEQNGRSRVIGLLWYILEEFSRSCNATLRALYPLIPNQLPNQGLLQALTRNGTLDICASASFLSWTEFYEYTYPVLPDKWCVMVPIERQISTREVLSMVLKLDTLLLLIILSVVYVTLPFIWSLVANQRPATLRQHPLYCLIGFCFGLQVLAYYEGQLQTLLIHPVLQNRINSFEDLQNSQVRIWGYRSEFYMYDFETRIRFATVFRLTDSGIEMVRMRNGLNTSNAYTITFSKYQMYAAQQMGFHRRLFHFSHDICIQPQCLFSLLMRENSVYYDKFNHFITKLRDAGLIPYWLSNSFFDMVKSGKMRIRDLSIEHWPSPFTVQDYRLIFTSLGLGLMLCFCLWLLEFCIYYVSALLFD